MKRCLSDVKRRVAFSQNRLSDRITGLMCPEKREELGVWQKSMVLDLAWFVDDRSVCDGRKFGAR
jgi:hypothetical protein